MKMSSAAELKNRRWSVTLCAALVLGGLGIQIVQYARTITNYAFTTYWSESYRIYSASLIYSLNIYGQQLNWPWLDPGRAMLDGLALLMPGRQIWMFRFWLAFLTITISTMASFLIIRRASGIADSPARKARFLLAVLVGWGTLYFLQGPVYYHVLLGILPVLWLFDKQKPVRTLLVVVAASLWEGICRVNWFGMPAVVALVLYLLTEPMGGKRINQYLKWPVLWMAAGIGASSLSYFLFISITRYPVVFFNPAMQYAFFTFKLWPNSAFRTGLIPGIAILSLPLLLLVMTALWNGFCRMHWLRLVMIAGILGVFFAGSTYMSLRAGGGFDLHNYDTFMVLLFILGVYAGFGRIDFDQVGNGRVWPAFVPAIVLVINILIPVSSAVFNFHRPLPRMTGEQTSSALAQLTDILMSVDPAQGPVLWIDQRQLPVYRLVPAAAVYQPYEKIELMEMAMANVHSFRDGFFSRIEAQAYPLIISEIHVDAYQDINMPFGYENNVWADNVSYPIMKAYNPIYINKAAGIGVYAPAVK